MARISHLLSRRPKDFLIAVLILVIASLGYIVFRGTKLKSIGVDGPRPYANPPTVASENPSSDSSQGLEANTHKSPAPASARQKWLPSATSPAAVIDPSLSPNSSPTPAPTPSTSPSSNPSSSPTAQRNPELAVDNEACNGYGRLLGSYFPAGSNGTWTINITNGDQIGTRHAEGTWAADNSGSWQGEQFGPMRYGPYYGAAKDPQGHTLKGFYFNMPC